MIRFENVSKIYTDGSIALDDVSFGIKKGEFVSIVGHSGAGKTTVTKLLLGEEKPSKGSVFFDEVNVGKLKSRKMTPLRQRIGIVFQDFRLLSNKTAYENIAFAMETVGKTDEEIAHDVPHVLDLVDLDDRSLNFPHQMSGGERQRLAIARAIINQPEVIIADEPTGNLDPLNTYEIIELLKKINDLGTTVILATHDKSVVDSLHKRVISLEAGRLVRDDEKGKYLL